MFFQAPYAVSFISAKNFLLFGASEKSSNASTLGWFIDVWKSTARLSALLFSSSFDTFFFFV